MALDMLPTREPVTASTDWCNQAGTRICAQFQIYPGNNASQPDIERAFQVFCEDMRDTLLVKQDN